MMGGPAMRPRPVTFGEKRQAGGGKRGTSNNSSQLVWTFADEDGHPWRGVGVVESDPAMAKQFRVTLTVARADHSTRI
jgi:hypothetical protein